jgi:hypothetical protein
MMTDPARFVGRAFFAGCAGAIGASLALVVMFVLVLVFASNVLGVAFIQSLPEPLQFIPVYFHLGGTTALMPSGEVPTMEIFMTLGDNPDLQHLTSISTGSSTSVVFWARAPRDIKANFQLWMTFPDGHKVRFGDQFFSDGRGEAINLGSFQTPAVSGTFNLEAWIEGIPVGGFAFQVTE